MVLIHHPPVTKPSHRFKRLIDADKFRAVLARHGAELVLHGHDHIHSVVMLDGPAAKIPAVGVPSASAIGGEGDLAAYNLYAIGKSGNGWRCEMMTRGFRHGTDAIVETGAAGARGRLAQRPPKISAASTSAAAPITNPSTNMPNGAPGTPAGLRRARPACHSTSARSRSIRRAAT